MAGEKYPSAVTRAQQEAVVVCADQLVEKGARTAAVAMVMDCMENSTQTLYDRKEQTWVVFRNWELQAKLAMWIITLIDGSPVRRSEYHKTVNVMTGNVTFDAQAVKDPALRARVERLIAQEQKPGSKAKPEGKQPQQTSKAQVVDTEFELAEGAAPAAKAG